MNERYEAEYNCDVSYSDPKKQELAEFFNDLIYNALDNCFIEADSKIEGLPGSDATDQDRSANAIANLVRALVSEYYDE